MSAMVKTMRLKPVTPTDRIGVYAPRPLWERVDQWRIRQRPIPSRSEAIRTLVEHALDLAFNGNPPPEE